MKPTPRVLILSASVGAGHVRAAQAIEAALLASSTAIVRNVDVLDLTNAAFRRLYGKAYLDLVNRAPHVLGYFYDMLDQPSRSGANRGDRLRLSFEKLNLRRFIRFLQSEPWDVVINTHFLPAEIIAHLRKQERLEVPQVTATTDFETHRLWVNQPCEHYFTATEEGARYLQHWGVPAEMTTVTGIPIHPVFREEKERSACLRKHGLVGDRPILLQMAGGFGVGSVATLVASLTKIERPLEMVIVAGRNLVLRELLLTLAGQEKRHRLHVLGYTHEIDELMAVADLVVSKPGGLTTSETLARGAAMVIVNPTPGQETRNSDYLLENGAAIKANNLGTIAYKVNALLADERRLKQIRSHARRLARPDAAFDVARKALALASKHHSPLAHKSFHNSDS